MDDAPPVSFPLGALLAAAIVDILEWFDLSLWAYIATLPILAIFGGYLWYWMRARGKSSKNKKALEGQVARLLGSLGLEVIPVVNWIPWQVVFVLDTYRRELRAEKDAAYESAGVTRARRGQAARDQDPGVTRSKRG